MAAQTRREWRRRLYERDPLYAAFTAGWDSVCGINLGNPNVRYDDAFHEFMADVDDLAWPAEVAVVESS